MAPLRLGLRGARHERTSSLPIEFGGLLGLGEGAGREQSHDPTIPSKVTFQQDF